MAAGFAGTIIVVHRPTSWVVLATIHFTAAYSVDAMTPGASLPDRASPLLHGEPASSSAEAASLARSPPASALSVSEAASVALSGDPVDPASRSTSEGGWVPPSMSAFPAAPSSPVVVPGAGSNNGFGEVPDDPQPVEATPSAIALPPGPSWKGNNEGSVVAAHGRFDLRHRLSHGARARL